MYRIGGMYVGRTVMDISLPTPPSFSNNGNMKSNTDNSFITQLGVIGGIEEIKTLNRRNDNSKNNILILSLNNKNGQKTPFEILLMRFFIFVVKKR